jgi:hypothetical protein
VNYVVYPIIAAAMLAAYLSYPDHALGTGAYAPGIVKFLPDLLSLVTLVYVAIEGVRQRFRYVNGKYVLLFGAITVLMLCGPLANQEAPGAIMNGARIYLRAIPLFFLPAVVKFAERDIQRYLLMILGLSLLQVPVAVAQRLATAARGWFTGDYVFGTLMISGILSIFLIAVLCVMAALTLRGRISKLWFALCFMTLVIPMSINETKVTVILLPLGLLVTAALASPPGRRLRSMLQGLGLLACAAAVFVPLYDYYNTLHNPSPFTIEEFFSDPGNIDQWLNKSAGVGTGEEAGRGTALMAPVEAFSRDPARLVFGLGLGNASQSGLGPQFSGRYAGLYGNFVVEESISGFLFELGFLSTALILLLHWTVLRDILFVGRHDQGLYGAIAPGYVGAWIAITISLFYLTIHNFESISFMAWFFAGLFAARRERLKA